MWGLDIGGCNMYEQVIIQIRQLKAKFEGQ
jgi:hypothetical protein